LGVRSDAYCAAQLAKQLLRIDIDTLSESEAANLHTRLVSARENEGYESCFSALLCVAVASRSRGERGLNGYFGAGASVAGTLSHRAQGPLTPALKDEIQHCWSICKHHHALLSGEFGVGQRA
jgi:hypothetical protein